MGRKKSSGFGSKERTDTPEPIKEGSIYSLPALYDLAFGYRNFELEVEFLLEAHKTHSPLHKPPERVLELAAGPARHSITALSTSQVKHVTAIDLSPEMVEYGTRVAKEELPVDKHSSFEYKQGDIRRQHMNNGQYDTAWILLGSIQHMVTNQDVIHCFTSACNALAEEGGTLILELPHPRETFSMVECTRNGWEVPLEDEFGNEYGELKIIWGDDNDAFDPISQVRDFTVSMELTGVSKKEMQEHNLQSVKEVVPMRMFTAQEIDALATCSGFHVAAMYGALSEEVNINDEDEAFRLVCVLVKD